MGDINCANRIENGIMNNVEIQRMKDVDTTFIMMIFFESYMMYSNNMVKIDTEKLAINEYADKVIIFVFQNIF